MASSTATTPLGELKFRSVLPHEPIPTEGGYGYLHVQGALCPKSQNREETNGVSFWTKQTLQDALSLLCSTQADGSLLLGLPFVARKVQILNAVAPFTKLRLVYDTPLQAFYTLIAWRRQKLTPSTLFSGGFPDQVFASRPFQVTLIRTTSPDNTLVASWNRSSPPKFRRLIARPGEDTTILQKERNATRFVFLSNLIIHESTVPLFWNDAHCVAQAIRSVMNEYDSSGMGVEVFVHVKKLTKCCHVGMRSADDARAVMAALQEKTVEWKWNDDKGKLHLVKSGTLFLDYAAITQRSVARAVARDQGREELVVKGEPTRSECTLVTAHVVVPGLLLIQDFVSEQEQAALMAVLTGPHAPWAPLQGTPTQGGVVKRRVQHYGYVFDYKTADVLRDRKVNGADCPPMPGINADVQDNNALESHIVECLENGRGWDVLAGVVERVRRHRFEIPEESGFKTFSKLNQLTVNHYAPGEGIGSHIDTPSAFGDGLISLSLNGGVVMEFRKTEAQGDKNDKKLVYLPPRSLLVMSGDARYRWEHMIVTRMTDTHNDKVLPRHLRISLTLRTALNLDGTTTMPLIESSMFPPVWGVEHQTTLTTTLSPLKTPDCERDHVHAVYDAIATQWHHTRGRRGVLWPGATQFLEKIPPGSVVLDAGCGDGKYFTAIWESGSYVIGTDISLPLLKAATQSESSNNDCVPDSRRVSEHRQHLRDRPAVAVADCMSIPVRTNSCDAAICIAVLHHLSTKDRQRRCIEELGRIVKPGGLINVQAWALEQEEGSRHAFPAADVFVPFNAQPKYLKLHRMSDENDALTRSNDTELVRDSQSTAQVYSKALNAEYDDEKGLVVFKRYCHLYRKGELEDIAASIPKVELIESGFESGNYFIILKVVE